LRAGGAGQHHPQAGLPAGAQQLGCPGSGLSRDQYVAYSAPCAARMPGSASLSRLPGSSASSSWSEPMPMARWIAAIGTSWPAWVNACHQVTACR
jgi:hypothetical protein